MDSFLDGAAAESKYKNPICDKCLNDWEICGKDSKDDMGDKFVHSIDSERKIAESILYLGT